MAWKPIVIKPHLSRLDVEISVGSMIKFIYSTQGNRMWITKIYATKGTTYNANGNR